MNKVIGLGLFVFQSCGGLSEVAWDVKVFTFHSKRCSPKLGWVD